MPITLRFYRRNLPHWLLADVTYFVTIRLIGTLPKSVVDDLFAEREALCRANAPEEYWSELQRRQFAHVESILDVCDNTRAWLTDARIAPLILNNLSWLRNRGWRTYAAVVMSNHVHVLTRNLDGRNDRLLEDLGQFKSFTARKANSVLKRRGPFWAREDFDHWIRSAQGFDTSVRYILHNPVTAGLVGRWRDWCWVYADEELAALGDH